MADERVVRKNPDVSWRTIEGQAVLVHNRLGEIQVLNEVGTFIWERLESGWDVLPDAISTEYGIDADTARKDLGDFLDELEASGAILPAGSQ